MQSSFTAGKILENYLIIACQEKRLPMLNEEEFITEVIRLAEVNGYTVEKNVRNGLDQINFGHKKLHAGHLKRLYPHILEKTINISKEIEKVAPGRPCTHKPMRKIIEQILVMRKLQKS